MTDNPFNRAQFDERYERAALAAAHRHGFAVPTPTVGPLSEEERLSRVSTQTEAALDYLQRLQQSQLDDSPEVAHAASLGAQKVLFESFVGDRGDAWQHSRPFLPDRFVHMLLPSVDPDGPDPWWTIHKNQRLVRWIAMAITGLAALGASWAVAWHAPLIALPFVVLAAAADIFQSAFARVVQMKNAALRWRSCVVSQAGDLLIIGGIALGQVRSDSIALGLPVYIAMVFALFGAFARVSALQAGFRLWRAWTERLVRYSGILAYCVFASWGFAFLGSIITAVLIAAFGLFELVRVFRRVGHAENGGFMCIRQDDGQVVFYSVEDVSEDDTVIAVSQTVG